MTRSMIMFALALAVAAALSFAGCSKEEPKPEAAQEMQGGGAGEMGGMGVDEHAKQMVEQHEAMQDIQREWTETKAGIERGDVQTVVKSAGEMEAHAGALDSFMIHKNVESRDEFLKKANEFRSLIMDVKEYAGKGDLKSLKEVAPQIDAACNGCHREFR